MLQLPSFMLRLRPSVIVLSGPPLHGKTSLANALAQISNVATIDVDEVRFAVYGGREVSLEGQDEAAMMACSYRFAVERARLFVAQGQPAAIAGTFSRSVFKAPLRDWWAAEHSALPFLVFHVTVQSSETIKNRIVGRQASAAPSTIDNEDKYRWALTLIEPWWDSLPVTTIPNDRPLDQSLAELLSHLAHLQI